MSQLAPNRLAADEPAIVQRAIHGDRPAFEWVMRHYNRRLYRLALAMVRNHADAVDMLQEAYLHAYRGLKNFRGGSSLGTWLARIVLNECRTFQRRSRRRDAVVTIVSLDAHMSALDSDIADESETPDRAAARAQMRAILERKVSELPERLRVIFVLRSVEELSVAEVAEYLDLSEASVRTCYFRAKQLLRESIAKDIDAVECHLYDFGDDQCDRVVANVLARIDAIS